MRLYWDYTGIILETWDYTGTLGLQKIIAGLQNSILGLQMESAGITRGLQNKTVGIILGLLQV